MKKLELVVNNVKHAVVNKKDRSWRCSYGRVCLSGVR